MYIQRLRVESSQGEPREIPDEVGEVSRGRIKPREQIPEWELSKNERDERTPDGLTPVKARTVSGTEKVR
jgi:hypothetical protein